MTKPGHLEVELKFEVDAESALPEAEALAPLVPDPPVTHSLSATYFDTVGLSLTRHGVTLRRRTGGDDAGWHLKLPEGDARRELRAPLGDPGVVPEELREPVLGLVRRQALLPIAQVDNSRSVTLLRDPDGRAVIEFSDDLVTTESFATATGSGSWREWEIELVSPDTEGDPEHLSNIAVSLADHGARKSSSPSKIARALGRLPDQLPAGAPPYARSLRKDLDQLLDHDAGTRVGTYVGIHQARVAVRGLRSTIQTFASELEEAVSGYSVDLPLITGELKLLARVLGSVRDLHVVAERLRELYQGYPEDLVSGRVRQRIETELEFEEQRAQARVIESMRTDRYFDLLDRLDQLVTVAGGAEVAGDAESAGGAEGAAEPTDDARAKPKNSEAEDEEVLLRGVDRQFKKFTKVRTRTERDLDTLDLSLAQREELTHAARKRAKALRRGVSALPKGGPLKVAPLRTACNRLHTVLGDIQDSVTTRTWLRRIMLRAEAAGEPTFGFGILFEHERGFSERSLEGFEEDAAAVTAAYRELSESRRATRKKKRKK